MKTLLPEINSADKRFHAGNPATGEQGTRVTDTWLNDVQDRVRDVQAEAHYVLQKAGFQPVENKQTQLYEAIVKIIDDNRKSASTTQKGEVRLTSDTGLDSEELGLTAKAGKKLAQQTAQLQLNVSQNYIQNSKKSSAVNSNSEDTVANSAAVKTAYDKGVEGKQAADWAMRRGNDALDRANYVLSVANSALDRANNANNNANGRVSKSGDTMTGSLAITGSLSGGFANGLMLKNKAGGQNTSVFVDFYQSDNIPRASMWMRDAGNNSTQIEFLNTPEGADWYRDSRQNVFTITSSGNLWSKSYGWLDNFFAKQSDNNNIWDQINNHLIKRNDFAKTWYPNHYAGTEVYKIRHLNIMITVMNLGTGNAGEYYLPEAYTGHALAIATDNGGDRVVGASGVYDGNKIRLHGGRTISRSVIVIGSKYW